MTSTTTPSVAPFSLDTGLRLESAQVVLPWNAEVETLAQLAKPVRHMPEKSKIVFLSWLGERVFDGLEVEAWYRTDIPERFSFEPLKSSRFDSAQKEYGYFLPRLLERFGPPHTDTKVEGHPEVAWRYGEVRISLCIAERFTDYVSFVATKGPNRAAHSDARGASQVSPSSQSRAGGRGR
jgi:hypothetical protein